MRKLVTAIGSIYKTEKLVPLKFQSQKRCCILEAIHPYADYYGHVPGKSKPNSLFLLTEKPYFLEEVLALANGLSACYREEIKFASAKLEFNGAFYPAIRIKHFPNYEKLPDLKACLHDLGVSFQSKVNISGQINTRVQKVFKLEEIEPGIYSDQIEKNKGYIFCDCYINAGQFLLLQKSLRNNSQCGVHDAVHGEIIVDGMLVKIIRVYAERLQIELLKCIRSEFDRMNWRVFQGKQKEGVK